MTYGHSLKDWFYRGWLLVAVAVIATIGIAVLGVNRVMEPGCTPVDGERIVNLPLAELAPGTAKTFCYRDAHHEVIRFIVARDSDGAIYSAFDACLNCFEHNQGYRLFGGEMVCRFCGHRYPLKNMGSGIASCVPIRLPHLSDSDAVQIKVSDLEAGHRLFQNKDD